MAKDRKKLVHIHSNITDKQPRPEALEVGEIAVNNGISGNTDRSFLSIKNANNEVVRFSSDEQMISWTEKKEVIPFEGQVRGENGPESKKDSGDYGSYGITNDDLLNNKSNLVIKFNQVAASNTPKSEIINGGKDIYGKLVNGTLDAFKEGAGIAIDMSRYAMRGANPSFSSLTITNGTTLEGGLNVSGNTKIGNGLNVTGATNINGATKITGDTTFNGNETVNGNLTVTGDTNISGNTTIKGDTNISGNTTIDKNLTVNGDTKLQKLSATTANVTNLYATSNISGSSLTATTISATTISGTNANITNLTANTISGGTLNVSGNTTLNKVTANTISASSISAVSISASNIYTKTEINNIENIQNSKINEISGKTDNVITDVQTLSGKVQTLSGKSVTSGEVQTMINVAVSGYPNEAEYNPTDKNIYFKHNDTILNSMTIDATDFIKDGMIESVEVVQSGGTSYLKIVWNLDGSSGSTKDTTYLNIGDLFEADNYYTKTDIDNIENGQNSKIDEISGKTDNVITDVQTLSGEVQTVSGEVHTVSGEVQTLSGEVHTLSGKVQTVSGEVQTVSGEVHTVSGEVHTVSGEVQTLSGEVHTLSGKVQTMINVAVSGYPNEAEYNSTDKKIYFKHNDTILPSMTIDATDFIKDGMIESVEVVQSGGTSYLKIVWNLDGSSGSTKKTIHLNIGDLFEADNYYTTGQTSGATQIANALAAKQNSLVSGINIKTINNESILGEGNITIEGGGSSYTAGDGIDITNDVISVTGKVDTSAFTAHTADTVIHVTSDEKAAWNGKQDQLISGVNIKTINNKSILGEGNITIEGGKAIEAGRGISVTTSETADTVSFNLPISAGTVTNALIYNSTTNAASGDFSHAEGYYATASGEGSHAEGQGTTASGTCAHAEGNYSNASGNYSHAEGNSTITNNQSEHASGQFNVSSSVSTTFGDAGNTLFSVGNGTSSNNRKNAFEIRQNGDIYITSGGTDIKLQNHLGGGGGGTSYEAGRAIDITNNLISLDLPISAGTRTNALIYNNTTNVASGYYSNAEGFGTTANGMCSHAEGENTTASGNFSHAEGESTIAKNMSEHASGQYNVSSSASTTFGDAGNTLFSVGNGISDSNRKNAFEIRQNGDTYLNGKLNITGDVTANAFYATSDERLKENIENVSYAKMANAANVNIKSFNFKSDEEKKTVIGVIAQDVENENLGFIVSTSNDGMKAVDYTGLSLLKIAYLEQKIKELENIINELKENKQ